MLRLSGVHGLFDVVTLVVTLAVLSGCAKNDPDTSMSVDASKLDAPLQVEAGPKVPPVDVLTHHNDNGRTGANTAETCLTPANVPSLTALAHFHMDAQVYAQPLLL